MRPTVSVVIPAHNPGRYVEPCIRSVVRQIAGTGPVRGHLRRRRLHRRDRRAAGSPGPRAVQRPGHPHPGVRRARAAPQHRPGGGARRVRAVPGCRRRARADRPAAPAPDGPREPLGHRARQVRQRDDDAAPGPVHAESPRHDPRRDPAAGRRQHGPTKLFRTALLREHEITFPEGWRQMEDQLFTLRAYLAARGDLGPRRRAVLLLQQARGRGPHQRRVRRSGDARGAPPRDPRRGRPRRGRGPAPALRLAVLPGRGPLAHHRRAVPVRPARVPGGAVRGARPCSTGSGSATRSRGSAPSPVFVRASCATASWPTSSRSSTGSPA